MRTKSSVRYIAKVVDLSQQELRTISSPPATAQAPVTPIGLEILPVTVLNIDQRDPHAIDEVTLAANSATTTPQGKIRKPRTKKQDVGSAKSSALRRKRTSVGSDESFTRTASGSGLCQVDFARLIEHNLKTLQQVYETGLPFFKHPANTTAAASAPIPLPTLVPLNHSPYVCSAIGCQRQMKPTAQHLNATPTHQAAGQRFSIFRSVELMAQSSCASTSTHARPQ